MREIKFRVWDSITKNMRYDVAAFDFEDNVIYFKNTEDSIHSKEKREFIYKPFKLLQYTGLKDVNGKEIYEGDILYALDNNDELEEFVGEVLFDEVGRFVTEGFPFVTSKDCFVKGNIYENSELLGVKNNV